MDCKQDDVPIFFGPLLVKHATTKVRHTATYNTVKVTKHYTSKTLLLNCLSETGLTFSN